MRVWRGLGKRIQNLAHLLVPACVSHFPGQANVFFQRPLLFQLFEEGQSGPRSVLLDLVADIIDGGLRRQMQQSQNLFEALPRTAQRLRLRPIWCDSQWILLPRHIEIEGPVVEMNEEEKCQQIPGRLWVANVL
eukprot:1414342-Rhodomonas_salina.3